MPLAAREEIRDVPGSLGGMADGAFRPVPRRPGLQVDDLLELVEDDHRPPPVHARCPVEGEQHFGDSREDLGRRRQLDGKTERAEGEFGLQGGERFRELAARSPVLRDDPGAQPFDRRPDPRLEVLYVVDDEQVDRCCGDVTPALGEVPKHLFDEAGLAHAAPAPEPRMRAGQDVLPQLRAFLRPVAVRGAGGDAERKQVEFGGHGADSTPMPAKKGAIIPATTYFVPIFLVPAIAGTRAPNLGERESRGRERLRASTTVTAPAAPPSPKFPGRDKVQLID